MTDFIGTNKMASHCRGFQLELEAQWQPKQRFSTRQFQRQGCTKNRKPSDVKNSLINKLNFCCLDHFRAPPVTLQQWPTCSSVYSVP